MARIIESFAQFFDDNGDPLVDGWLKFNESGTNNTDKDTFKDVNETLPNTNPVQLSGAGRCPNVFGPGSYNVISFTDNNGSPGTQIQQFDPVGGSDSGGAFGDWNAVTIYGDGDIVTGSDGNYYISLENDNQNNDPTVSEDQWEQIQYGRVWNQFIIYDITDSVYGGDGLLYISRAGANLGNDPLSDSINWRLFNDEPDLLNNVSFTASVAAKALTFDLKTNGGLNPSSGDKVIAAFRGPLTSADYTIESAIAATTITAPDGATLGFGDAGTGFIYLYLVNNAGTLELGISGVILDSTILHTSIAIDATADEADVLYTTAARVDVAIRSIGRIKIEAGAVAGEWDNAPSELFTSNGFGVADTKQIAKVWVNFNGVGTVAIRDSYNVSSITDNGTGNYTVNFTSNMADTNYATAVFNEPNRDGTASNNQLSNIAAHSTSSVQIRTLTSGSITVDSEEVNVIIFGAT